MSNTVLHRVVRRELHSPRTAAAAAVLVVVALAAIAVGVEIVLHLLGADPLLVAPDTALNWLRGLPEHPQSVTLPVGIAAAVIGLVLVWLAVAPGRRPKHELGGTDRALITDNGVIASAVAERVRRELDLSKGAVVVGIGHRNADVTVRPEPGQSMERARVRAVAEEELDAYALRPRVKVRARVLRSADQEDAS